MKKGMYKAEAEHQYYKTAAKDRRAVSYKHLDSYIEGSVGMGFFRGKRVLDIGAGEGVYSAWIADPQHGGAKEVLGIELIEHRIRRDYEKGLRNLRFESRNVLDMQPEHEGYDIVFMNLVLHHLRFALDDILRYVIRSLKPGGQFLAIEPNVYSPPALIAHIIHDRSANEGFLSPHSVRRELFRQGFGEVHVGYFWRNRRWAKNPLLGSCFWIIGTR